MKYYRVGLHMSYGFLADILLGKIPPISCNHWEIPNGFELESIVPHPDNRTVRVIFKALERQCGKLRLFEVPEGGTPPDIDYRTVIEDKEGN